MGVVRNLFDGLTNALSGLGGSHDPRSYNRYFVIPKTDPEIDAAYRGSWVMRKIIDKPATEMVREWRDWQADSGDIEKLEAEEKRLDLRNKVRRAEMLRGLGGAGMVLWTDDSDQSQPLKPESIQTGGLKVIHVWHRSRFQLGDMIEDWRDPWFGHPSYYEVQLQGQAGSRAVRFHPSRVVAFRADPVAEIVGAGWADCFWGQSKVETVLSAVENVDTAEAGFAALIKDARNRRLYVPKLTEQFATEEGEKRFTRRATALAMGESTLGITFLDAGTATGSDGKATGGEKLEDRQMVWTGIPDIKSSYWNAAAAAADMPATVLWGVSPQGMNATGQSDIELWHKTIRGRQDLDLRPCMTQIDAALIPSALGKVDDTIWYEWAPLSTQSEKDEANTFFLFMQAAEKLQATGAIPDIAFEKALQNTMEERGWLPGIGDALAEMPEDERFPSLAAPDPSEGDPSALGFDPSMEGGDPFISPSPGQSMEAAPRRRAANDMRFTDAEPRTLYVQRKLLNAADFIRWAKAQGFDTMTPAAELHVTIAYSRTPLDWMKIGQDWSSDASGNLTVPAGGPRIVQRLGDKGAVVLLFGSNDLAWRHKAILEAGASFDFDEYQPHVTITYAAPADFDLAKVQPYTGPLKFGPELFSEVDEDWVPKVVEDGFSFADIGGHGGNPNHDPHNGQFTSGPGGSLAHDLEELLSGNIKSNPKTIARKLRAKGYDVASDHPEIAKAVKAQHERIDAGHRRLAERLASPEHRAKIAELTKRREAEATARAEPYEKAPMMQHFSPKERAEIIDHARAGREDYAEAYARLATVGAIAKQAKSDGWTIRHVSKEGSRATSRYLVHPNGNEVRVSDHFIPSTPKREAGYRGKWAGELVVGREWRSQSLKDYMDELQSIATETNED